MTEDKPIYVEAGKFYSFCACGKSNTYPLCDGTHKGTGIRSLPFQALKNTYVIIEKGQIKEVNP